MQLANYVQINDRRTEKIERDMDTMMGLLQHMSMGVVFLMDATGQRHSVPLYMAGSFDVCRCGVMSPNASFTYGVLTYPAIQGRYQSAFSTGNRSRRTSAQIYGYRKIRSRHR